MCDSVYPYREIVRGIHINLMKVRFLKMFFYILDSSARKDYNKKTNKCSINNYSCNEESPMFGDTGLSTVRKYWRTPYVM